MVPDCKSETAGRVEYNVKRALKTPNRYILETFEDELSCGAVLLQGNLIAGSNNIDVSSLASGVYILEVTDSDGMKTERKIVKQ